MMKTFGLPFLGPATALQLFLVASAFAADLTVWWDKGYYPEQDRGIEEIVAAFEKEAAIDVDLAFQNNEQGPTKLLAALAGGEPPDVAFGGMFRGHVSRWAHEGSLVDLADVVAPIADRFDPRALEQVKLYNSKTGGRSYYALPVAQATIHIHAWKPMLQRANLELSDIPRDWNAFWSFWCDVVQPAVREATGDRRIYGMGMPMSSATDTDVNLYMFLIAYGAEFIDPEGQLHFDDPQVRRGVVRALESYAAIYLKDCTPPGSVTWANPDNNVSFINQLTVMTPNPTLSIPASQRASNPDAYFNDILTIPWPDRPDGGPITYVASTGGAVIFRDAKHVEAARRFLAFLAEPERLQPYIEASLSRFYPVMPALAETSFWQDRGDPHRQALKRQFTERPTTPLPIFYDYRYSQVVAEAVWPSAIGRIVIDGWPAEQAAEEAIARTKQLMGQ